MLADGPVWPRNHEFPSGSASHSIAGLGVWEVGGLRHGLGRNCVLYPGSGPLKIKNVRK